MRAAKFEMSKRTLRRDCKEQPNRRRITRHERTLNTRTNKPAVANFLKAWLRNVFDLRKTGFEVSDLSFVIALPIAMI